ncbi:MAG: hypothetical protein KJ737_14585 [Proteobacteria bacterium]|nr:hypothetical protein [Pseudomonadota bacterium]
MLDIAVSYNKFKFIGNEFLTWIWYIIENDRSKLIDHQKQPISLEIGNHIVLENRINEDSTEIISIKGDDADLKEGILALKKGAVVIELHLFFKENEHVWKFNIKGESFHITGLKPPETGKVEEKEDIDGAILEKYYLYSKIFGIMDDLFKQFITLRVTPEWEKKEVPKIKSWIL